MFERVYARLRRNPTPLLAEQRNSQAARLAHHARQADIELVKKLLLTPEGEDTFHELGLGIRIAREFWESTSPAGEKSLDLMLRYLTDEQIHQLATTGVFLVVGSLGGEYEIRGHIVYKLRRSRGKYARTTHYCMGPASGVYLPDPDIALGHKLLLETDEKGWLYEAIKTQLEPDVLKKRDIEKPLFPSPLSVE